MIVFGDPSFRTGLRGLIARATTRLGRVTHGPASLDELRWLLIQFGQIEQAAEDAGEEIPSATLQHLRNATDSLARAFIGALQSGPFNAHSVLEVLQSADVPDLTVTVKVPEGFAFYSLFPEQYLATAEKWAREHESSAVREVLVVGIRSIGTTLSAVVSQALVARRWHVRRLTVRPTGHPFERRADIPPDTLRGAACVLVVDEGPGASGSSMASVARAVVEGGFSGDRIAFLPGHGGEPGPHASEEVLKWWGAIPRFTVPLDEVRWGGRSLQERLGDSTGSVLNSSAPIERVEDLSAGLWREVLHVPGEPRVFPLFERAKYRCVLRDGRAMLWKFGGFGPEAVPNSVATVLGYSGFPWIAGTQLAAAEGDSQTISRVGQYIRSVAGPVLSPEEQRLGFDRLAEMLYWNTLESVGEEAAQSARQLAERARAFLSAEPVPGYGDGRLSPWEWVRTADGALAKVDAAGHVADHTMIGKQPVIWDAAGAIVEWGMDQQSVDLLLASAGMGATSKDLLDFHRLAYAAFRLGMSVMCQVDGSFYRDQLARIASKR